MKKILLALAIVPISEFSDWNLLTYSKITPNILTHEKSINGLKIAVNKSASPVIYRLPELTKVSEFNLKIRVEGKILQNELLNKFPEDSYLRLGFVTKGNKRLNWLQRKIAADWVIKLYELAPKDMGLDKIYFYNISYNPSHLGLSRQHPKSDLIKEEIIAIRTDEKVLTLNYKLKEPKEVVALWISVDGDDTMSSFESSIEQLTLN